MKCFLMYKIGVVKEKKQHWMMQLIECNSVVQQWGSGVSYSSLLILQVCWVMCKAIVMQFFVIYMFFTWNILDKRENSLLHPSWCHAG